MLPFSFRPMSRILIFVSSSQITDLIGFNTFTIEAGARFNFVHLTSHFAQCLKLVIFSIVHVSVSWRGVFRPQKGVLKISEGVFDLLSDGVFGVFFIALFSKF